MRGACPTLHFGEPWWQRAIRVRVIYVAFLIALRIFGKRELGQFTFADLVLLLLEANGGISGVPAEGSTLKRGRHRVRKTPPQR